LDGPATSRTNQQIDRLIESKSRGIERRLHRRFAPTIATRYFDWPSSQMGKSWRLWLDADELISATTVTAGGATVSSSDYFLEPANLGPPYDRLEMDISSSSAFGTGNTHQRDIAIAGLFGYTNDLTSIGALSSTLSNTAGSTANATWTTPRFGVGDILLIDSERVVITGRNMSSSAQTLQNSPTASTADTTIAVTAGTSFLADTVLLIDSERMFVVDVAGNNLIVKRAWDGSVLAAHTAGATVYTYTGITLDRAQFGTTIASHSSLATIYQWQVPGPVRQLCIAEVLNAFQQEASGYARTIGSGDNVRNAMGAGIEDIRRDVMQSHGRQLRMAAV
jgi:hypothetical protein